MWATLALAAALQTTPAQPGAFALKNPRATYGLLGQPRKDVKFLGGDLLVVTYDLQNLKVPENGIVEYSLGIEVTSKGGKSFYKLEPQEFKAEVTLGGNGRPASSFYEMPFDMAPGEYVFTVTGTDLLAKQSAKLEVPFEVLSPRLGFVQSGINIPVNQTVIPTPPKIPVGQTVLVGTGIVGFELGPKTETDPKKKQPHVTVKLRILDESGKPTLPKDRFTVFKDVDEQFKKVIPFNSVLELNRTGKFKIEITATDMHTSKTAVQTLDLEVFEVK
jgi:hypothetical protein